MSQSPVLSIDVVRLVLSFLFSVFEFAGNLNCVPTERSTSTVLTLLLTL